MIGVVITPGTTCQRDGTVYFQVYDLNGGLRSTTLLHREERERDICLPSFAVTPNGNIDVFWSSYSGHLYWARIRPNGNVITPPRMVAISPKEVLVGGPLLPVSRQDKIIGIGGCYCDPTTMCLPCSTRLVMDREGRVLQTKDYLGFEIRRNHAIAVDERGTMHLVTHLGSRDHPEISIIYRSFDADGNLEEETTVASKVFRGGSYPGLGISLDAEGTVHIYYTYARLGKHPGGRDDIWEVGHVVHKGKAPAKGPRSPIVLTTQFEDVFTVDKAGAVKKLPKPAKQEGRTR